MTELIILRGAPGSGKSTAARGFIGYSHYETDQFFVRDGHYNFDRSLLKSAHAWCLSSVIAEMERGNKVVVSNTFTKLWEMEPYIDAAQAHGYSVRVFRCRGQWDSIHNVPFETVQRMRENYEPYDGELEYHAHADREDDAHVHRYDQSHVVGRRCDSAGYPQGSDVDEPSSPQDRGDGVSRDGVGAARQAQPEQLEVRQPVQASSASGRRQER